MPELTVIADNGRRDVVELLGDLYEQAKEGKIHSVAVAGLVEGNKVMTAFKTASDGDKFGLLGAVNHVQHRINQAIDTYYANEVTHV